MSKRARGFFFGSRDGWVSLIIAPMMLGSEKRDRMWGGGERNVQVLLHFPPVARGARRVERGERETFGAQTPTAVKTLN